MHLGAGKAAALIATGEVSSERLTHVLLERLKANRHLNAFITVNGEGALREARQADAQVSADADLPPLHGVPVVLKDNVDVAGLPNTAGTPALAGHIPQESAPVAQALMDAGAIVLGKTNMHELALGITSQNFEYGSVRNPYNALTIAGGSSGGTAAVVAALMVPAGLGTYTGGSNRPLWVPAQRRTLRSGRHHAACSHAGYGRTHCAEYGRHSAPRWHFGRRAQA